MEENDQKKNLNTVPGIAMVGCMFLGIGIGYFYSNVTAGTLIGLGAGFILMAVLRYAAGRKKS